jgi:SpoVK/Ycf46/Vps4 family AAA+-type ATPase
LKFIDTEIVQPRSLEPGKSESKAVVVLLFGPPGTTKTTIARAVAGGLRWPLVTLSPGNFIDEGLEKVEPRAGLIFDQLERLSRTVVIFDECDELFRARTPAPETEPFRNVSAFITASMLPKLQDLHDRGRVVVFICTNFLSSIDPAMRRIGRIDHLVAVAPPDRGQRRATIEWELGLSGSKNGKRIAKPPKFLADGVSELVERSENFIRGEVVAAARKLDKAAPFESKDDAVKAAKKVAKGTAMAIDPAAKSFKEFEADRKELSEPHRRENND